MGHISLRSADGDPDLPKHNSFCSRYWHISLDRLSEFKDDSCGLCSLFFEALISCLPPNVLASQKQHHLRCESFPAENYTPYILVEVLDNAVPMYITIETGGMTS
jgi:hypothetical protein